MSMRKNVVYTSLLWCLMQGQTQGHCGGGASLAEVFVTLASFATTFDITIHAENDRYHHRHYHKELADKIQKEIEIYNKSGEITPKLKMVLKKMKLKHLTKKEKIVRLESILKKIKTCDAK